MVSIEKTFPVIPNMPLFAFFWCTYACKLTKKQSMQHTHNQHAQPSHHGLLLVCFWLGMWGMHLLQQGWQVLHYVHYSLPKMPRSPCCAARAADVTVPAAVVTAPATVAKAIPSAPTPRADVGMPVLVAKKAKVSKESAPATLDESAVHWKGGRNDGPRPPHPRERWKTAINKQWEHVTKRGRVARQWQRQ